MENLLRGKPFLIVFAALFFLFFILFLNRETYFVSSPSSGLGRSLSLGRYKSESSEFINARVVKVSESGLDILLLSPYEKATVEFGEKVKMGISVSGGPILELPGFDISQITVSDAVWLRLGPDGKVEQILVHKEK